MMPLVLYHPDHDHCTGVHWAAWAGMMNEME